MLSVWENFILLRQKSAAGIHQINAGQAIGAGDLLRAHMLFHGQWKIGAALHRGIIRDDHTFAPRHAPNARDNPRARNLPTIKPMGRELRKFQEGRTRINQRTHTFTRQQLIARQMLIPRSFAAALFGCGDGCFQIRDQRRHGGGIGGKVLAARIKDAAQNGHAVSRNNSRPINMRRISEVPAPIS